MRCHTGHLTTATVIDVFLQIETFVDVAVAIVIFTVADFGFTRVVSNTVAVVVELIAHFRPGGLAAAPQFRHGACRTQKPITPTVRISGAPVWVLITKRDRTGNKH